MHTFIMLDWFKAPRSRVAAAAAAPPLRRRWELKRVTGGLVFFYRSKLKLPSDGSPLISFSQGLTPGRGAGPGGPGPGRGRGRGLLRHYECVTGSGWQHFRPSCFNSLKLHDKKTDEQEK